MYNDFWIFMKLRQWASYTYNFHCLNIEYIFLDYYWISVFYFQICAITYQAIIFCFKKGDKWIHHVSNCTSSFKLYPTDVLTRISDSLWWVDCDNPGKVGRSVDKRKVSIPHPPSIEEEWFKYKIDILQLNIGLFRLLDCRVWKNSKINCASVGVISG